MKNLIAPIFFFLSSFLLKAQQYNGLNLLYSFNGTVCPLVDTNGVTVGTFTFTEQNGYSAYMVPGGIIYRTVKEVAIPTPSIPGMTGKIQKIGPNSNVLWEYSYNFATGILHHDFVVLPNGNVLCTAYDVKTGTAIAQAGSTSTETTLMSERIVELQPVGTNSANIVWEWKMWDHLVQNVNPLVDNYYPSLVNHPELFNINYLSQGDFVHMNGIDYNPLLDQIVFSSRYRSEWYVIDHSTTTSQAAGHTGGNSGKGGDILYRYGNPLVYQASAPQVNFVNHDPHWIPEGSPFAGDIAFFNNGGVQNPTVISTVDRVAPPRTGYTYSINVGSAFTPTTYQSRHTCPAYNIITGSAEQYPNGNQMVCLGTAGVIYEINSAGVILWSYNIGSITPQAHRYPPCYTVSPAPTQPSISISGASLISTSAPSYQWYFNGTAVPSATNQNFVPPPGQNGNYLLRTSNGCAYFYSSNLNFNPPLPNAITLHQLHDTQIILYPNPSSGNVQILHPSELTCTRYAVYDLQGRQMMQVEGEKDIDLGVLQEGMYLLEIHTDQGSFTKKILYTSN